MLRTAWSEFYPAIGADPAADTPRLTLADYCDEHRDPHGEFIRVQCALASTTGEDSEELRKAEQGALLAHRAEWVSETGLPVSDVHFSRGVLDRLRITKWKREDVCDAAELGLFATLSELDLSGLKLKDADVAALLDVGTFPNLRRLLLNGNKLTEATADAIANCESLQGLQSVYLFGNEVVVDSASVRRLERRLRKKAAVDCGVPRDGYSLTHGQCDVARRALVRDHLLPLAGSFFKKYEHLRSAMLAVAQYWCDEADDAVHDLLVVSELPRPSLAGIAMWGEGDDLNIPNTNLKSEDGRTSTIDLWRHDFPWDENSGAIPLWASFVEETWHQEYETYDEAYTPAVYVYRHGGYEFCQQPRPHLNGLRPEWEREYGEE